MILPFRSEEMQLIQLYIQSEAAFSAVDELGALGVVEFRDMNASVSAFQRNFVGDVKRLDELHRKLAFFRDQCTKANVTVREEVSYASKPIYELEASFDELEKDLKELNQAQTGLDRQFFEMLEHRLVLTHARQYFVDASGHDFVTERRSFDLVDFGDGEPANLDQGLRSTLLGDEPELDLACNWDSREADAGDSQQKNFSVGYLAGVVHREKCSAFERVMFRALRGNMYLRTSTIEGEIIDPATGLKELKNVFIVFFSGRRSQQKIHKICTSFNASCYPYPENPRDFEAMMKMLTSKIEDTGKVRAVNDGRRVNQLTTIGFELESWFQKVLRDKSVYHTMNLFNYDIKRKCLIGEGWCPKGDCELVQQALTRAKNRSGLDVPCILNKLNHKENEVPPTYFKTDKYTQPFQDIVEAYGVARYREFNPSVFAIVSFPFLFAVMFGDFGHGMIMTLFGLSMVLAERRLEGQKLDEMVATVMSGRYLILLMGIFSVYVGTIYNDTFSCAFDIFGSGWTYTEGNDTPTQTGVYMWGLDPAWKGTPNMLLFVNSMKMKISIIFGVSQMMLGIFLKALNEIHFRNWKNFWLEFVPQFIFMGSIFGYIVFIILLKWSVPNDNFPSIISMLIGMFLNPGTVDDNQQFYWGQGVVQVFLLLIAFVCVPWMLLPKPILIVMEYKNSQGAQTGYMQAIDQESQDDSPHEDEEELDIGTLFVNQTIHTIEFVLGSISNTASYLRLWALSLAHAQLSEVFWDMLLVSVINMPFPLGPVAVFCGFAMWAAVTFGVLMMMESLSAFLHALRLHWVEFQNKFYCADGVKFVPFSYATLMDGEE